MGWRMIKLHVQSLYVIMLSLLLIWDLSRWLIYVYGATEMLDIKNASKTRLGLRKKYSVAKK